MLVPNAIINRNTLTMVCLVDLPKVDKNGAPRKLAVEDCLTTLPLHPLRLSLGSGEEPTPHCHQHIYTHDTFVTTCMR